MNSSPTTGIDFNLPQVRHHQRSTTDRIIGALSDDLAKATPTGYEGSEAVPAALAYASGHHYLQGAINAARRRDAALLDWYREAVLSPTPPAAPTPSGYKIIVHPPREDLIVSDLSDTAHYLLQPASKPACEALTHHVHEALALASEAGFKELLTHHLGVICLLDRKAPTDTLHSWTITTLPGTTFTDYTEHPEILGRDLVHEAAHTWLNEALTATNTTIHDDLTAYSPWRRTIRPAFGFLHACWAFPLTMIYTQAVLATAVCTRDTLVTYLRDQQRRLPEAHDDFIRLVRTLPTPLRDTLVRAYDAARNVTLHR